MGIFINLLISLTRKGATTVNNTPQVEMPQYRCHKVVRAAKITALRQNGNPDMPDLVLGEIGGIVTVLPDWHAKNKPQVGGYYVVYEDGYRSYSPAKAFEEGYVSLADDTKRRREAFDKAGYWPNEVMWKAWNQAWDAAQGKS